MVALDRKPAHSALIRELASNVDRAIAGERQHVCLRERRGEPACACYRDAHHGGWHRCLCGAEWQSSLSCTT